MKRVLSILLLLSTLANASEGSMVGRIRSSSLQKSHQVGNVNLFYTGGKFLAQRNNRIEELGSHQLDASLRSMNKKSLNVLLAKGYISVNKADDGSLMLRSHAKGLGGGVFGANFGFFAGKFAVHFVGHGLIQIAALCTGPAYFATLGGLEACCLPSIEAASNIVGCATGIATAVATGPV